MVQTDPTQYARECASWRENLRNYRSELSSYREKLQDVVSQQVPRNELPNIEHYNNQFEIQLTNINKEIEAIALAIGVDHHKSSDAVDLSGLRYRKIIILADADEFFVFEGCEERSLSQYVSTIERDAPRLVLRAYLGHRLQGGRLCWDAVPDGQIGRAHV